MDNETRQDVDRLLLEQGDYSPIELLLAQGRLFPEDYEAWRGGEAGYLEDHLFGDPAEIRATLTEAAAYAKKLGLEAEARHHRAWGGGGELKRARAPALDTLLATHHLRPAARPQLDLFMDGGGNTLVNTITAALAERDSAEAHRALQQLRDNDPGHRQLGALERLVEGAEQPPREEPAEELQRIEETLQPLAEEQLGSDARAYLTPLLRRLHERLAGHPYAAATPRLHASHTAERLGLWNEALEAIEGVPAWRDQAALLRRHARAAEHDRRPLTALADWFQLCWRHPDESGAIGDEAAREWRDPWRDFLDLDPELPEAQFPAWLLIQRPGLAENLHDAELEGAPESFHQLRRLIGDPTSVDQRKALQTSDPPLFQLYLARRG
ncbi:hypothetical protein [Endothiovibrio diazotrophicus]